MSDFGKAIEVDVWKATLRRTPDIALASAKNFAAAMAAHDRSDPSTYDRVLSSLLNGASVPEDYYEFVKRQPDRTGYEIFNRVNVTKKGSAFELKL